MQELITPVQFESALDSLNQITKLSVSDKVHLSIDAMQGCKNPIGTGNPIIGKFIKEDNQGALCCHKVDMGLTSYESFTMHLTTSPLIRPHTFAQKVYGVLVRSWNRTPPTEFNFWTTPGVEIIEVLPFYVWYWLSFVGNTIWFSTSSPAVRGRIEIRGFY